MTLLVGLNVNYHVMLLEPPITRDPIPLVDLVEDLWVEPDVGVVLLATTDPLKHRLCLGNGQRQGGCVPDNTCTRGPEQCCSRTEISRLSD